MTEEFIKLIQELNRDNTDKLLTTIKKLGFFEAPASANHHLNKFGGLVEHSISVYNCALHLKVMIQSIDPFWKTPEDDSIRVAALLHDVCKADMYYTTVKRQRMQDGTWKDVPTYGVDYSQLPLGHGEKSISIILQCGYPLTREEMLAIRWHMSSFKLNPFDMEEMGNFRCASVEPLVYLIQAADQLSTHLNK